MHTAVLLEVPGAAAIQAEVADSIRREVAAAVTEFARALDLQVTPVVQVADSGSDDVRVSVNGHPCPYPEELIPIIYTYLTGFGTRESFSGRLRGWVESAADPADAALAAEYLAMLAVHAIDEQPSVLLPAELPAAAGVSDDEAAACLQILRQLLDLGLPAGDLSAVVSALRDSTSVGEAAERLIAERAPGQCTVLISPGYLRELSLSDIPQPDEGARHDVNQLVGDLGVRVPPVRLQGDESLRDGCFRFRINQTVGPPVRGLPLDRVMLVRDANELAEQVAGLDPIATYIFPLVPSAAADSFAERGVSSVKPHDYLRFTLGWTLQRRAARLVNTARLSEALNQLKRSRPVQVRIARSQLPLGTITGVLRDLADEGVPIRDLPLILDQLLELELSPAEDRSDALSWVRRGMKESIGAQSATGFRSITVRPLAPEIEALAIAWAASGYCDDGVRTDFLTALRTPVSADLNVPLLVADEARRATRLAVRAEFPELRVLAAEELPADFTIEFAEQAEAGQRAVVSARRRLLGDDDLATLTARLGLGMVLIQQGQLAEAEAECRAVVSARRRLLGDDDVATLEARLGLGMVLVQQGQLAEAETECQAVASAEQLLGDEQTVVTVRMCLGGILTQTGRLAEAEEQWRIALAGCQRLAGDDDPMTQTIRLCLAQALHWLGRLAEAETEYRLVADSQQRVLGADDPATLATQAQLATVMTDLSRRSDPQP